MPGSPYGGGRYDLMMQGDPFWGALAGLAVGGVKKLFTKKVATKVATQVTNTGLARITRAAIPAVATATAGVGAGVVGSAVRGIANRKTIGTLAVGAGAATAATQLFQGSGRKYRRMNALNPKALTRATRRLAAFHTFAQSTEQALRRLAPSSSRRCAPRRKACR